MALVMSDALLSGSESLAFLWLGLHSGAPSCWGCFLGLRGCQSRPGERAAGLSSVVGWGPGFLVEEDLVPEASEAAGPDL